MYLFKGNEILTEDDRDNIRAFKLKILSNMSLRTFNHMRHIYRHRLHIDSRWVILHRLTVLSGIKPVPYDCCINACIAYTGRYAHHTTCPFCNEHRYSPNGHTRRSFYYLPLIPRLQGLFQSEEMIKKLSYRELYKPNAESISDVFDGTHYQDLLTKPVVVDGIQRPYPYFSGKRDIALSLCTDGFLLFKRRRKGPSATPILLQNYNLPPRMRISITKLICLGILPGPRPPKDYQSFLEPVDEELATLAMGVRTFDALDRVNFDLRAYVIFEHGDIVAIERILGIKGHNGYSPCRSCKEKGVRNVTGGGKNYYIPLTTPDAEHHTRPPINPRALALRHHDDFDNVLAEMDAALTGKQREAIAKYHGIRQRPALHRVGSINRANSVPWDWMHLFSENVIQNLVHLWMGKFKGLDVGSEDYEIMPEIWEQIGEETENAVKDIPATFVRVLGNIANDQSRFTAESWGFWFMYLAPILLKGRFSEDKYYTHMCLLVKIMKTTLKFKLTLDEIDMLEEDIIEWVQLYEK
jgi:hypothetical protein